MHCKSNNNMDEKIQNIVNTRQEYNFKIYALVNQNRVLSKQRELLLTCIEQYSQQRFGQIICNYICPDYRDAEPSVETILIMDAFFPENPDPFYEEPQVTYARLKRNI